MVVLVVAVVDDEALHMHIWYKVKYCHAAYKSLVCRCTAAQVEVQWSSPGSLQIQIDTWKQDELQARNTHYPMTSSVGRLLCVRVSVSRAFRPRTPAAAAPGVSALSVQLLMGRLCLRHQCQRPRCLRRRALHSRDST